MNVVLKDTLNSNWKDDKTGFGYKMLQKMGWKEEKGLGKNESGNVSSIKIKKREEGLGLGMEKLTDGAGNAGWSATASSFNSVLELLKSSYGNSKSSKKSKSKSPSVTVGIKYKKHSLAKDMSSKSSADLQAVLGSAHVESSSSSSPSDDSQPTPITANEANNNADKKRKKCKKSSAKDEENVDTSDKHSKKKSKKHSNHS